MKRTSCFVAAMVAGAVVNVCGLLHADVMLPKVLSDNMVVQRDKPIAVWGTAASHEAVTVEFEKQKVSVMAGVKGEWIVHLAPTAANSEPQDLVVHGSNVITIHNVLIGEVWLCGGQSNMEYAMGSNFTPVSTATQPWSVKADTMRRLPSTLADLVAAHDDQLRLFKIPKPAKGDEVTRGWEPTTPHTLSDFSAIGYYFGKRLRSELHVPIGMMEATWGGTRIEPWTPVSAYAASPVFHDEIVKDAGHLDGSPAGNLFDRMVSPMAPFTLRGFLWYQGESNVLAATGGARYEKKMEALIDGWRSTFQQVDAPFYYVQIAPLNYSKRKDAAQHPPTAYADVHAQQTLAMQIPHTGMVVTTDLVDNLNDIHPGDKIDVADRLANWALAKDYGRAEVEYSGPVFNTVHVDGGTMTVSFTHADSGLETKDRRPPTCFEIGGADGKFYAAQAIVHDNVVALTSSEVPAPTQVRFAQGEADRPNLVNRAALPAVPFIADATESSPTEIPTVKQR